MVVTLSAGLSKNSFFFKGQQIIKVSRPCSEKKVDLKACISAEMRKSTREFSHGLDLKDLM